jgi:hypothetical protein
MKSAPGDVAEALLERKSGNEYAKKN